MSEDLTKIRPLSDYVLIDPVLQETMLPSGIVLPDSAKEKPQKGKVVAIGTGKVKEDGTLISMTVKLGDVVMYKKWGGTEIKVSGKEMLLVKEEDILAIVEG